MHCIFLRIEEAIRRATNENCQGWTRYSWKCMNIELLLFYCLCDVYIWGWNVSTDDQNFFKSKVVELFILNDKMLNVIIKFDPNRFEIIIFSSNWFYLFLLLQKDWITAINFFGKMTKLRFSLYSCCTNVLVRLILLFCWQFKMILLCWLLFPLLHYLLPFF